MKRPVWQLSSFFDSQAYQFSQETLSKNDANHSYSHCMKTKTTLQEIESRNQDIVLSSAFQRQSKDKKSLEELQLVLCRSLSSGRLLLYLIKDYNDKLYEVNLVNLRMERFVVTLDNQKIYSLLRFSFLKETLELLTSSLALINTWYEALRGELILHQFHEQYTVTKMIGKGHFAKVYMASHNSTKAVYAVKAFSKDYLDGQEKGKEAFINEIFLLKGLDHKNILKLYEIYETENSLYLVLQLVKGGELLQKINQQRFDEKSAGKCLANLLAAVSHMHSRKIIHRDLKPDNILLKSSSCISNLIIADFGLATFLDLKHQMFKRCGTPGYVAPEILRYRDGERFYDEKCDIFSCGVIFFILLTGHKLFKGDD